MPPHDSGGVGEVGRPGPGLVEAQDESPAPADGQAGHVEYPVAHGLRLDLGQRPLEADRLAPGQECTSDEADGHPGFVADEGIEGQVGETAVLPVPDPVLHPGVSPVAELEGTDVGPYRVGDEAGVS